MSGYTYMGGDVARAVKAERERCAKIAEDAAGETADGEGELYIARRIADRIRNATPPDQDRSHEAAQR